MYDLPYTEQRSGAASRAFVAAHPNSQYELVDYNALKLPSNVDIVFNVLYYHDLPLNNIDTASLNKRIFDALKPGGVFFIVDHNAAPGSGHAGYEDAPSHRSRSDQEGSVGGGLRAGGAEQAARARRRRSHQDGVLAGAAWPHRPDDLQVPQAEEVASASVMRPGTAVAPFRAHPFDGARPMNKSPGHQNHPEHRVAERHLDQRMTVSINGEVIADSQGRDRSGRGPLAGALLLPALRREDGQASGFAEDDHVPVQGHRRAISASARAARSCRIRCGATKRRTTSIADLAGRVAFYDDKMPEIQVQAGVGQRAPLR